jgi:ribonuclease BN (tRNA processing enzyme)
MKITILGTGGALPPKGRAQTGIYLEKEDGALLVDCGSGILFQLSKADIDLESIETILITHHHLDHMSDLLPIITARWLSGISHTKIIGPEGTADLVSRWISMHEYVEKHISVDIVEIEPDNSFEAGGFQIDSLPTEHWIPTVAFRFDNRVVFSADTAPINAMCDFAKDCELLVHECSTPNGEEMPFHTSPKALGELLSNCNIKKLVLTHFYPPSVGHEKEMASSIKENYPGEVIIGEDLMEFDI